MAETYASVLLRGHGFRCLQWVNEIGGAEQIGPKLLRRKKDDPPLPEFVPPTVCILFRLVLVALHFFQTRTATYLVLFLQPLMNKMPCGPLFGFKVARVSHNIPIWGIPIWGRSQLNVAMYCMQL